jgi:LacI family transcriptional regulator
MAVRLKDIAQQLGVSVVTVSKVLRDHRDISPATKQRVWKRMRELNYRPNLTARALVTGRSYAIGLIVPDLTNSFFAEVAKGISRAIREKGFCLVISSSEEDAALERQEIEQLLARRVDALILASTQKSSAGLHELDQHRLPYVLIDRNFPGMIRNFVGTDDVEIGRLATRHLIERGYRRIAHIAGPNRSTASGRRKGYRLELAGHGIKVPTDYIATGKTGDDSGDESGYRAMRALLTRNPRPDAVFCFNDPICLGAMRAILEAGLHVPGQIGLIGCGNIKYSELLRVPLSTIDQDAASLGEQAARLALGLIESSQSGEPYPATVLVKPRLIARQSTTR